MAINVKVMKVDNDAKLTQFLCNCKQWFKIKLLQASTFSIRHTFNLSMSRFLSLFVTRHWLYLMMVVFVVFVFVYLILFFFFYRLKRFLFFSLRFRFIALHNRPPFSMQIFIWIVHDYRYLSLTSTFHWRQCSPSCGYWWTKFNRNKMIENKRFLFLCRITIRNK